MNSRKNLSRGSLYQVCVKRADINRSTYYKYFANPYDQLDKIEGNFLSELAKLHRKDAKPDASNFERVQIICEFFFENRETFLLLSNNGGMRFTAKMYDALKDIVFSQWNTQHYKYNDSVRDFSLTYVLAGSQGILHRWLSDNVELFTPSQMAKILLEYNDTGLKGTFLR